MKEQTTIKKKYIYIWYSLYIFIDQFFSANVSYDRLQKLGETDKEPEFFSF